MKCFFVLTVLAFSLVTPTGQATENLGLNEFLSRVEKSNPKLRSSRLSEEAFSAGSEGFSIPAPMVGITQMSIDGQSTAKGFEVNQEVPFPSKITRDLDVRQQEANREKFRFLELEAQVLANARLAFFTYWKSLEEKSLLIERKSILQRHIKLMRAQVRSDSTMALHLMSAESDFDLLENEITEADGSIIEARNQVAVMQGINPEKFEALPQEPAVSPLPLENNTPSYQIKLADSELQVAKAQESLAQASWYPDFSIKYKAFDRSSMNPPQKELMVGLTLPFIFFGKTNADIGKASALRKKAEADLENTKFEQQQTRFSYFTRAQSLFKQMKQLETITIPKAQERIKLIHNLVPRDMDALDDHRNTTEALIEMKLKNLRLRSSYEEAVAILNQYSGDMK